MAGSSITKLTNEQKLAQIYLVLLAVNEGDADYESAIESINNIINS